MGASRRARLAADGGGLENRYGVTPIVGSNPTPSATGLRSRRPGTTRRTAPAGTQRSACLVGARVRTALTTATADVGARLVAGEAWWSGTDSVRRGVPHTSPIRAVASTACSSET